MIDLRNGTGANGHKIAPACADLQVSCYFTLNFNGIHNSKGGRFCLFGQAAKNFKGQ